MGLLMLHSLGLRGYICLAVMVVAGCGVQARGVMSGARRAEGSGLVRMSSMAADNASRCATMVGCLHSSNTWWMSAVGAGQKGPPGEFSLFDV